MAPFATEQAPAPPQSTVGSGSIPVETAVVACAVLATELDVVCVVLSPVVVCPLEAGPEVTVLPVGDDDVELRPPVPPSPLPAPPNRSSTSVEHAATAKEAIKPSAARFMVAAILP
jgi:hypothetical protein